MQSDPAGITTSQRCRAFALEPLEGRVLASASPSLPATTSAAVPLPRPDHVVILVEENQSYDSILGPPLFPPATAAVVPPLTQLADPYLRQLAAGSASFTQFHAAGHENAISYQAIFSGIPDPAASALDAGKGTGAPNLASELLAAGLTFTGYSESIPHAGYAGPITGLYNPAHNPWVKFSNVPTELNQSFSNFPHDFGRLPTVSYVVPNLANDMHSGSVHAGDRWLRRNINPYVRWARSHNSLLIVTWDESTADSSNQIPTLFAGQMVRPGNYGEPVTPYRLLRTLADMYGVTPPGNSAAAAPITGVWRT